MKKEDKLTVGINKQGLKKHKALYDKIFPKDTVILKGDNVKRWSSAPQGSAMGPTSS